MPHRNLIANIGFGNSALHTTNANHRFANMPTHPITFPLTHPDVILPDREADESDKKNRDFQRRWPF